MLQQTQKLDCNVLSYSNTPTHAQLSGSQRQNFFPFTNFWTFPFITMDPQQFWVAEKRRSETAGV